MSDETAANIVERGRGWKQDRDIYIENTERMGSLSPRFGETDLPRDVNVLGPHCEVRDQDVTSSCVGFGYTGAAYARLHLLGYDPPLYSPQWSYALTRMLERVGLPKKPPLEDIGSFPFLAQLGHATFGFLPERERPFDPSHINDEVDFDEFQKASQFRLSGYRRITSSRKLQCMRNLAAGKPIPFGMQVGNEFSRYRRGLGPVGIETVNTGGHMTFLVGYREHGEIFIGCNSWSRDYGDNGFYEIHVSKLEHETTRDLVAFSITDAPPMANARDKAMDLLRRLHGTSP